ncbi:MAG: hypothetical protein HKN43_04670 [Rhodothermales bacterium]|nr:hypothetical protein [Rhodothermales bacterium]
MKRIDDTYNRAGLKKLLQEEGSVDDSDLLELWDSLEGHTETAETDSDREDEILATLLEHAKRTQDNRPPLRLVASPVFRYGMVAAIAFIAVAAWFFLVPVTQTSAPGSTLALVLPDGSNVALNSGSSISYNRFFTGGRDVELQGEGYFDVLPGSKQFTVATFNARVQVLGTTFNVRSWETSIDPGTEVTLLSGKVQLIGESNGESVTMQPGDQVVVAEGNALTARQVDDSGVAVWRDGNLFYSDELLGVVLEDVQRRFGVGIQLSVPEIAMRRINVSFHSPADAEVIVRTICGAYSLNYRKVASGFEIFESD